MKRIKNFNDFDDLDFISESRVYFMNDLLQKLRELRDENNEWALKLLKSQGKNIDTDTTFLELNGENLSFSKEVDIKKALGRMMGSEDINDFFNPTSNTDFFPDRSPTVNNYLGSYEQNYIKNLPNRGQVKIGRVIKKLLPEIPDKDLENLVNILKSEQRGYEIKLVKGDDIAKYYKKENCDKKLLNYGTLQSSCMMDKADKNPNIFDIYTKNPEVCQLAVMLNSNGELVGRSLVWKVDEVSKRFYNGDLEDVKKQLETDNFWKSLNLNWNLSKDKISNLSLFTANPKDLFFMDRVYYTKDWIENAFQKWARENKFMIRAGSSTIYNGFHGHPVLNISVNKIAYRQFPYMDTFKHYDVQSSKLCNYEHSGRGFNLQDTTGRYYAKGTNTQKTIDKATNYIRRFKDYLK